MSTANQFIDPNVYYATIKGGFPVISETTRNYTFSKEISQVMLAAMVLAPDFYCKNCQRVISAVRGNPPLEISKEFLSKKTETHFQECSKKCNTLMNDFCFKAQKELIKPNRNL